ncbi:homoserine kinase [Helicovermis profundi]|uniref:Homoserine kinase n=1 Tax=Helicovermis profundi TaxID=3065157 RepID=A0AAU9E2E2_9FIRM|nr:homoserine kinase [Clostridia bacterium S502]
MFTIKVPATTANIGPGFDSIGIALNLFNEITVEKSDSKIFDWGNTGITLSKEKNLILTALEYTMDKFNISSGYHIVSEQMDIPISRGLGSSAASIVLGVYAAFFLMDFKFEKDKILEIATELEGHPDNVAPAIFGNLISSALLENSVIYSKTYIPNEIVFNVLIPDFKLSTEKARSVLPSSYSKEDCIFNISRVALLISALNNNEISIIKYALKDRIHQPYRLDLIENGQNIFEYLDSIKSLGYYISGAGPTLISLDKTNTAEKNKKLIKNHLDKYKTNWLVKTLEVCKDGVELKNISEKQ